MHTPLEGYWKYTKNGMIPAGESDLRYTWVHQHDYARLMKKNEAMKGALEALTQRVPEMMNMSGYYDGQVKQVLDNAKNAVALAKGKDGA